MSSSYISAALRRLVRSRASSLCEYCLIHEDDTFFGLHIDHVISEKHGGPTDESNLALACTYCNLYKGSDVASFTAQGTLTRFFNPRLDQWSDHFQLVEAFITPRTPIGEVTVSLFQLNTTERILERRTLIDVRRYPSEAALIQLR